MRAQRVCGHFVQLDSQKFQLRNLIEQIIIYRIGADGGNIKCYFKYMKKQLGTEHSLVI